jgi:hypothetical protein
MNLVNQGDGRRPWPPLAGEPSSPCSFGRMASAADGFD